MSKINTLENFRYDNPNEVYCTEEDLLYRIGRLHRLWSLDQETATLLLREVAKYVSLEDSQDRFCLKDRIDETSRVSDRWRVLCQKTEEVEVDEKRSETVSGGSFATWKGSGSHGVERWWAKRPWNQRQKSNSAGSWEVSSPSGWWWHDDTRGSWSLIDREWAEEEDEGDDTESQNSRDGQWKIW